MATEVVPLLAKLDFDTQQNLLNLEPSKTNKLSNGVLSPNPVRITNADNILKSYLCKMEPVFKILDQLREKVGRTVPLPGYMN
jgi:hypothetical protein